MEAAGGARGGVGGVVFLLHQPVGQGVDHGLDLVVALHGNVGGLVKVEVLLVKDNVHVAGVAELAQFHRGELHLGGAAATKDVHVGDGRGLQPLVDVVRDLGDKHVVGVLGQHPRHIQCHVAVANDGDLLGGQRPFARHIRVPVVPGHEVGPAVGALQLDAGDVQVCVLDGAGREDDGVVVLLQVFQHQVRAVLDVAEEANVSPVQDLVQRVDNALDARMVRGNAIADQSIGGRVTIKEVDADHQSGTHFLAFGQHVCRINAGRA